jgi:site-specific DNA-methyltransferase (adenine-specific)
MLAKIMPLKKHEIISVFYVKKPLYNPQMTEGVMWHRGGKAGRDNKNGFTGTNPFGKGTSDKNNLKYPKSIITFSNADQTKKTHPTQKPVALMEYLIKTYTLSGETVLDFTMGSGTTGVACVNLDRKFIGIEKDPNYFKIAEKRINAAYMTKLDITCKTCTSGNPCPVECPLTPIERPV